MSYPKELEGQLELTNVPCGECKQPLMSFPPAGAMFCFYPECPGHHHRSIIDFPTLRCFGCGLTEIVRVGAGRPAECNHCSKGIRLALIPEVLRKFIPEEESITV